MYSDDEQLNGKVTTVKLGSNREIELTIPGNGGVLILN
jgi:hypothetical protein